MLKVLTVFGTRPEAIKLAPIVLEFEKCKEIESVVCVTAQHRHMLDQVMNIFDIIPDIDLDLMQSNQTLSRLTSKVITEIDKVIKKVLPDIVLVQGDTATVMATSLVAFYNKIPVGHVEAGLRTNDISSPFPEEMNRRITSLATNYHFAPTEAARQVLLKEGVDDSIIFVTGNPVIDALQMVLKKPVPHEALSLLEQAGVNPDSDDKKLILITAHRRENFGDGIENICYGIKELINRNKNLVAVYPVHLNPNVKNTVSRIFGDVERVFLTDPLEYDSMAHIMNSSFLVLTDSGGLQEEAPALGKPVFVLRTETERPEGIQAGTAKLIGPDRQKIVSGVEYLLANEDAYNMMSSKANPYGDGQAAKRIVKILSDIQQE